MELHHQAETTKNVAVIVRCVLSQQRLQVGLLAAWGKLPSPAIAVDELVRNPFPAWLPPGWSLYDVGLGVGWLTSLCVYLALGYMTFLYRWRLETAQP